MKGQVRRRRRFRGQVRAVIGLTLLTPAAVWVAAQRVRVPGGTAAERQAISTRAASRPHYRHSVVPGGVYDSAEVEDARRRDTVVSAHYAGIGARIRPVRLESDMRAHVSYRIGKAVYWTRNRVRIAKGEVLLTDGGHWIRARCGNRVSVEPRQPTLKDEPAEQALDTAEAIPPQLQASLLRGQLDTRPATPVPGFIPGLPTPAAVKPPYNPELPFSPPFFPVGPGGSSGGGSSPAPVPGTPAEPGGSSNVPADWAPVPSGPPYVLPAETLEPPDDDGTGPLPPAPQPAPPEEPAPAPPPPTPPAPPHGGGSSVSPYPQPPPVPPGGDGGKPPAPPPPYTPPSPPVQPPSWLEPEGEPDPSPDERIEPYEPLVATPEPGTGLLLSAAIGLWWAAKRICTLVSHARPHAACRRRPARGSAGRRALP